MTWLAVFALSMAAEALGDILSAFYQRAVRKLWRRKAARWAVGLAALGWVDLSGIALQWPLSALLLGSVTGSYVGTWWAVGRQQVQARVRRKRKEAADE